MDRVVPRGHGLSDLRGYGYGCVAAERAGLPDIADTRRDESIYRQPLYGEFLHQPYNDSRQFDGELCKDINRG